MTFDEPKSPPAQHWLSAFVPLGSLANDSWSPLGGGVLFLDDPLVWLLTTGSVLEAAGDTPLSGWVKDAKGGTLVDLTTGRRGSEMDWIRHPELDVVACLFPVDPAWQVKAFPESRTFHDLEPLLPSCTVCCAYGLDPLTARPTPLVLPGAVAAVDEGGERVVTTAPLLPRNAGAPLLIPLPPQAGGGVSLGAIVTRTIAVPESHQSTAAPVRLASAIPVSAAIGLVRSEEGKTQRRAALAKAAKGG